MDKDSFELAAEITIAAISDSTHTLINREEDIAKMYEVVYQKIEQLKAEDLESNPL